MRWESRCACCPLVSFVLSSTVNILSYLTYPFSLPREIVPSSASNDLACASSVGRGGRDAPSFDFPFIISCTHTHTHVYTYADLF